MSDETGFAEGAAFTAARSAVFYEFGDMQNEQPTTEATAVDALDAFEAAVRADERVRYEAVAKDARGTIAFLRSCVDSGERLSLTDRARILHTFDHLLALERGTDGPPLPAEQGRADQATAPS